MSGFVCGPKVYKYKKWLFEFSYFCPWPLKQDGEPRRQASRKFWAMYDEFDKLPEAEKEKYRVGGGCIRI